MKKQKKVAVHSFRKRSHSNPSISQLLNVACYKKHIKNLIKSNRKLAAELESTRVQNGILSQQVKDLNKNHHYVKYARVKVTEIANNFSKCVTDVAEVIKYLDRSSTVGVNFFLENISSTEKLMVKVPLLDTIDEVSVSSTENIIQSECPQTDGDQEPNKIDGDSENHCSTSGNNGIEMSPQTYPGEASENRRTSPENDIVSRNKIELAPILFVEDPEVKNKKKSSKVKKSKNSQNVNEGSLTPILDIDDIDLNTFSRRKTSSRRETKHFSFPKVRGSSKEISVVPHIPNPVPQSPVPTKVVFPAQKQVEGSDQIEQAQRKIHKSSNNHCGEQQTGSVIQNLKCISPGTSNPTDNNTASSDVSGDLPTEHLKEIFINRTVNQSEDMELTEVIHYTIPITLNRVAPTEERKNLPLQADNNVPQDVNVNSSCEKRVAPSVNNHEECTPDIDRPKCRQSLCFSSDDDSFCAVPRKGKGVENPKSKGLSKITTDRLSIKKSKDVYELDVSDSKMKKPQKSKSKKGAQKNGSCKPTSKSRPFIDTLSVCLADVAKKKLLKKRVADQQLQDASLNKHAEKKESNIRLSSSLKHPDTPRSSSKRVSFAITDQILMFTDKNIENKEVSRTSKSSKEIKKIADQVAIVAQEENVDFSGDTELYQFPLIAGVNSGADNLQLTSKSASTFSEQSKVRHASKFSKINAEKPKMNEFSEKPKVRLGSKSSNEIKVAADSVALVAREKKSDFSGDTELYQFPLIAGVNSGTDNLQLTPKSVVSTFSEQSKVRHASKFTNEIKETNNPAAMMIPTEHSDFSGDTELYQFSSKSVVSAFSEKSKNDPNCKKNKHISQKRHTSEKPTEEAKEDLKFSGDTNLCALTLITRVDTAQSSSQPTISNVAKMVKSERCDQRRNKIAKKQQTFSTQSSQSTAKTTNAGFGNCSEVTEKKMRSKASSRCRLNAIGLEPTARIICSAVVGDDPKDKRHGQKMDLGLKNPKKTTQKQALQNTDEKTSASKKGTNSVVTYSSTEEATTLKFSDETGENGFHPDADNFPSSSKCISETSREPQRNISKRKESLSVVKNKISTMESLRTVGKKRDDLKENVVTSDHQDINNPGDLSKVLQISEKCAIDCGMPGKSGESSPALKDVHNLIDGSQIRVSSRRKTKSINYKEPPLHKKMRRE